MRRHVLNTGVLGIVAAIMFAATSAMAANVYFKAGGNGHWADGSNWEGGEAPGAGDSARLYLKSGQPGDGGTLVVETEEDWTAYNSASEVWLFYGSKLSLKTDTDRSSSVALRGGNLGEGNRVYKKGSGKLTISAQQQFRGITVIEAGQMTMGPTAISYAGVYDVAYGATLELNPNQHTYLLGLRGEGTVTGTGDKQLSFVTSVEAGQDPEVKPPYHFSGTLTGNFGLTAGAQTGAYRVEGQYFDNLDTSTLASDLRLYGGIFGVKSVGTKTAGDPSSIGTAATLNYFANYSSPGDTIGLLNTATSSYMTDKDFSLSYGSYPGRFFVFDGGAYGGVTFTGKMTCNSSLSANAATCFVLDGSNTTACVLDNQILENSTSSGHVFLKRGTGVWKLGSTKTHGNKGPILVERGRLEYTTLADAGSACSLGLMTQWSTNFYDVAECPPVSFACLLGNGDNEVDDATATIAYTGDEGASCSTRPLGLKGAGRFANDSGHAMTYAGATVVEEGKNATLVLAGSDGGTFTDATNGVGRLSVVKEGAGTWNLQDGVDLAAVTVKEGTLTVGMNYQFYRWTVTANNRGDGGGWIVAFDGFAIMDAAGNMLNGTLGKNGMATGKNGYPELLEPGQICYNKTFASTDNRTPDRAFEWNPETGKFRDTDASINVTLDKDDPSKHPIIYFRTDPGVRVAKYDVMASGNATRDAVCWELAGSVDGKTWDPLHTRETNSVSGYQALSRGQWHSTGTATRGGWDIPCGKAGATFSVGSVSAAADATLAFVGNAAGTTVTNLVLDAANGGGTITGVKFAAAGTLELVDWDNDKSGVRIPIDLGGCEDYANIANWTVVINGSVSENGIHVDKTGITVLGQGFCIIIR